MFIICFCYCSLNSHKNEGNPRPLGISTTVSKIRKFKQISANRLTALKTRQLKKRTFNKMQWGVRAYHQWREHRISDVNTFDARILECDLTTPTLVTKENFIFSMCAFIPEVTKVNGQDYPGKTLYEIVLSIQTFLNENKVFWKVIDDLEFFEICTVLDNVMKERALQNLGTVVKQAQCIPLDFENQLWEKGVLGEQTPDQLRDTILFLVDLVDEHYELQRNSIDKPSQFSFERAENGKRCLVYREDSVTKTNDGGLNSIKKQRKVVWVFPNDDNIVRCPVRLVDKYVSLLPEVGPKTKKLNFYMRSLEKPNPAQWYSEQVVGKHTLSKTVGRLLKEAKLDGFFTNHSLRRTGSTRLFQAGVDRKIVKEYTGHMSDAVRQVSNHFVNIYLEKISVKSLVVTKPMHIKKVNEINPSLEISVKEVSESVGTVGECSCNKKSISIEQTEKIGKIISSLLSNRKKGKATVRLEIEFSD